MEGAPSPGISAVRQVLRLRRFVNRPGKKLTRALGSVLKSKRTMEFIYFVQEPAAATVGCWQPRPAARSRFVLDSELAERQSRALRFPGDSCFLWRTIGRSSY